MYVFICSAARSGSTLLDIILGGHSEMASLGEFSFLNKAISLNQQCSCGSNMIECEKWRLILEQIKEVYGYDLLDKPYDMIQWDAVASRVVDKHYQSKIYVLKKRLRSFFCDIKYSYAKNSFFDMPLTPFLEHGINNSIRLYDLIISSWEKKAIIDSSKNIHKAISIYEKKPEKVKIIYLIRDGRGVFNSRISSGFSKKESFFAWKKYNLKAYNFFNNRVLPEALNIVKYEDLVADPERCIRNICSFLNVVFQEDMLDISKGDRHLVNGNKTMYKRGKGIKADIKWISELDIFDEKYFYQKCGSLNQQLGYEPRSLDFNNK